MSRGESESGAAGRRVGAASSVAPANSTAGPRTSVSGSLPADREIFLTRPTIAGVIVVCGLGAFVFGLAEMLAPVFSWIRAGYSFGIDLRNLARVLIVSFAAYALAAALSMILTRILVPGRWFGIAFYPFLVVLAVTGQWFFGISKYMPLEWALFAALSCITAIAMSEWLRRKRTMVT